RTGGGGRKQKRATLPEGGSRTGGRGGGAGGTMFSDLAGAVEEVSGARWRRLDVSGDGEVALLTEVLRAGSEIEDPARLNAHFGAWYGRQRKYERYVSVSRRGLGEGEYKITRMRSSEELKAVGVEPANPW